MNPVGGIAPGTAGIPAAGQAGAPGLGPNAGGIAAARRAAARVAQLQSMIEAVESGPAGKGSFGAALAEASAVGGPGAAPAIGEATPLTPTAYTTPSATTAAPAPAGPGNGAVPYQSLIEESCARYGVDPALLAGLIEQESHFDPTVGSPAGAQGLTELMPETAASLGVTDPHDPAQSIDAGARLLSEKLAEFGGNTELALAAYNAGSGAVHQYDGIPPYPETQEYVRKVLGYAAGYANAFGGAL
ncbi:MAG TPA: lytic transglycosylase domain-containing protein [Solirubrobacterales bacterium]|nr:lytic transglycosylase domain-containing protein [Solirubrobacterales bacterium]